MTVKPKGKAENSKKNGAKVVTATQDAAAGAPNRSRSIFLAVLVAVVAFGAGALTPPLWLQFGASKKVVSSSIGAAQRRELETPEAAEDSAEPNYRYPCTRELLDEFFHETNVPGFHILCFEMDDSKLHLKSFQFGVERTMKLVSLDLPVAWPFLKSLLTDSLNLREADQMHQPWALFTPEGERILDESMTEEQVGGFAKTIASQFRMVLLYEGGQFLWPGVRIGFERQIALYSIMPPESPEFPDKNSSVTLETLSLVPLVLSVKGFLSSDECQHIQQEAIPSVRYSDVVLMDHDEGRPASDFRTSQTTFLDAGNDGILLDIDYRTASLVRIPRSHQEPVQVLRYGSTERYTSHHDYFNPQLYQKDKSTLWLIQNGRRNRMVTVFWYLSDVEEGGETIFPRAGGGREKSFDDCETGLKVKPQAGKVIIFYSMTFDGRTDENSLHGACPVREGIKWAGNKWVWNEPMTYVPP